MMSLKIRRDMILENKQSKKRASASNNHRKHRCTRAFEHRKYFTEMFLPPTAMIDDSDLLTAVRWRVHESETWHWVL